MHEGLLRRCFAQKQQLRVYFACFDADSLFITWTARTAMQGCELLKCSNNNQAARARGSVHIVEHRHPELETIPSPPSRYQFNPFNSPRAYPDTSMVIVVSQNPRVYCYLYSGNYQFAGIHYGIRDGFDDLQAPACIARRNTRQRELRATCVMHPCTSGRRIAFSRCTNGQ